MRRSPRRRSSSTAELPGAYLHCGAIAAVPDPDCWNRVASGHLETPGHMTFRLLLLAVSATLLSAACHSMRRGSAPRANASMRDAAGNSLGVLELTQGTDGVHMVGNLTGLPPGTHGI